jgi:hypothetical protein
MVREELVRFGDELGFDVHVYDRAGYPADPGLDPVSACVEAIDQHDIVVALADEEEGTEVDVSALDDGVRGFLVNCGILPAAGSGVLVPTIFQVEVLVARQLAKPTVVLMTTRARELNRTFVQLLRDGALQLNPRVPSPRPPDDLIAAKDWNALAEDYDVPSGRLASLRHAVFLERVERDWVRYYNPESLGDLKSKAADGLASVPLALMRTAFVDARARIRKERPVAGALTIADLMEKGLILSPPHIVRSGGAASGKLYSPIDGGGSLRDWLLEERSVALLGHPGLGKSTLSLLVYASLEDAATAVPPLGVIWGSWRDLTAVPTDWEAAIRHFIGLARQRAPWPAALALPNLKWILLLDSLDESPLGSEMAGAVLSALEPHATLLVSCRLNDFPRYGAGAPAAFEVVVELTAWEDPNLEAYAAALDGGGYASAAAVVRRLIALQRRPTVIGVPLWLSMSTYLAETSGGVDVEELDDYELVRRTMTTIASAEMSRQQGSPSSDGARLLAAWQSFASLLQERRRQSRRLYIHDLADVLGVEQQDPLFTAALSLLDVSDDVVRGFQHEILHDFFLGEHIASRLPEANADEVSRLLGWQRRGVANDAVRRRVERDGHAIDAAATLRERFDEVRGGPRLAFVKNQILYFLGRVDTSSPTRDFLARVWRSEDEEDFVRYSAAFTGAMIGAQGVEAEYYQRLRSDPDSDALNRGYHLFYHGDIDVSEEEMPHRDDGSSAADRSIEVLVNRLRLTEPHNRRLRRIELFTLRRFIETRGLPNGLRPRLDVALESVAAEMEETDDADWAAASNDEIAAIRAVVNND